MSNKKQEDRSSYLDTYFPSGEFRSVHKKMTKGLNYDDETLTYITPASTANSISNTIKNIMGAIEVKKYIIYDICGCIGGSGISFALSDDVKYVLTYEPNIKRVEMLKRNINLYGLGDKSIVYPEFFKASTQIVTGSVVFFDPPWLDESVSGTEQTSYDQYITSGIKLGNDVLEQYLYNYNHNSQGPMVYLVVMHLPPNYQLMQVDGWEYAKEDVKSYDGRRIKRTIIYCTCKDAIQTAQSTSGGYNILKKFLKDESILTSQWVDPLNSKPKAPFSFPTLDTTDLKPVVEKPEEPVTAFPTINSSTGGEIGSVNISSILDEKKVIPEVEDDDDVDGLNKARFDTLNKENANNLELSNLIASLPDTPSDMDPNNKDMTQWATHLRLFISIILSSIINDPKIVVEMVSARSMATWVKAFTHSNYDAKSNYETLETMGDAVLEYTFRKYLFRTMPGITDSQISNFEAYYMAKIFQSKLSSDIGFHKWVRIQGNVLRDVKEDLFESFFGALDEVGDSIQAGFGSVCATNLVELIFKNRTLDPRRGQSNPKTLLTQTSNRLRWDDGDSKGVYEVSSSAGNKYSYKIMLSKKAQESLSNLGYDFPLILSTAIGTSEKSAKSNAYINAADKFHDAGFTQDVIEKERAIIEMKEATRGNSSLYRDAKAKAKAEYGSDDIRFNSDSSTTSKNQTHIELRVMVDGYPKKLGGLIANKNTHDVRVGIWKALLENYIKSA